MIECANSLFGALFAPVAAHRGLGTRSEFTLTDPVLNGLPPPLHAPDALDRLIHLAKHCAVALEASILEYSATAAAVLSTGGGLGARLDQAYGVENGWFDRQLLDNQQLIIRDQRSISLEVSLGSRNWSPRFWQRPVITGNPSKAAHK